MNDLVSPSAQAPTLIQYIGDKVTESGRPIELSNFGTIIDVPSSELANHIIEDLSEQGLVRIGNVTRLLDGTIYSGVTLSLDGWNQYRNNDSSTGKEESGFIAMQFGDRHLDNFVNNVVKPAVRETGYDLVDMRDVTRAGVIDNIMRAQIMKSVFVIVDLTHDNSGAYWEAGYAEGLKKPVIYICEESKFKTKGTHFDTNHCTTILWSKDDPDRFRGELIATLRRSIDQH